MNSVPRHCVHQNINSNWRRDRNSVYSFINLLPLPNLCFPKGGHSLPCYQWLPGSRIQTNVTWPQVHPQTSKFPMWTEYMTKGFEKYVVITEIWTFYLIVAKIGSKAVWGWMDKMPVLWNHWKYLFKGRSMVIGRPHIKMLFLCRIWLRGHGGAVVRHSPPTSEIQVWIPAWPQVGKLVVACHWSAVYSTES